MSKYFLVNKSIIRLSTYILCIETTTEICSVCVSQDDECIRVKESSGFKHSAQLMPMIIDLLNECNLNMKDLGAIALSKGPGSYTGLRVGASTAKGLAYALDIPMIGINTLKSLASNSAFRDDDSKKHMIMPMIDARRDEVYTAVYDNNLNEIKETHAYILNDLESILDDKYRYTLCGNGASKVEKHTSIPENVEVAPSESSATGLCSLAYAAFEKKEFVEIDHFEPDYLKPPNIAKPKTHF